MNITSIGLTGETGGKLSDQADIVIHAPASDTAVVQTWHLHIYHCLCEMLETEFFPGEDGQ
jgi:D-sedoheptulose 7-phosphate isomerase